MRHKFTPDPDICSGGTRKCREPHLPGRYYCEVHATANRAKARRNYLKDHPNAREGHKITPPVGLSRREWDKIQQSAGDKKRYLYRVSHGLCTTCAGNWAESGSLVCSWCRETRNTRNKRRRQRLNEKRLLEACRLEEP